MIKFHYDIEQLSEEWFRKKTGLITGTRLEMLMGKDYSKLLYKIHSERVTGVMKRSSFISPEMERGLELEEEALSIYEGENIGLIENGLVAISPDKIKNESIHYEAKSPDTATHVRYILENVLPLEYRWQIVHSFVVNDKCKKVVFVSYDNRYTPLPRWEYNVTLDTLIPLTEADRNKLIEYSENKNLTKAQEKAKEKLIIKSKRTIKDLVDEAKSRLEDFEQDLQTIENKLLTF